MTESVCHSSWSFIVRLPVDDLAQVLPPRFIKFDDFFQPSILSLYFLAVEKKFPGDRDRLARMSLIEG